MGPDGGLTRHRHVDGNEADLHADFISVSSSLFFISLLPLRGAGGGVVICVSLAIQI